MRISRRTGSAEEPPTPEQLEQWQRKMSPPDNEFPASVGLTVLLGRTDDTAVGLTNVEAFSTGFRFTLAVRVRQPPPRLARGGLHMLISSHGLPGIDVPLEDRLLLGLEYADGRRASTLTDMPAHGMADRIPLRSRRAAGVTFISPYPTDWRSGTRPIFFLASTSEETAAMLSPGPPPGRTAAAMASICSGTMRQAIRSAPRPWSTPPLRIISSIPRSRGSPAAAMW